MNILQINSVCGIGSTGRIATDLHAILQAHGHQSTIAFGREAAKNCATTIRIGNRLDNYSHVVQTRLFDKHGFASFGATRAFLKVVQSLNPDIIHLHNIHGYYLHVGLLFDYLSQANKPVIWTLHDCWSFTGHCAYFDLIGCARWKTECFACPLKNDYPQSFFDYAKRNYHAKKQAFLSVPNLTLVTPSKWLAGLTRQSFLQQYPVSVINNGIDLSVFKPSPSAVRQKYQLEGQFIILGVAADFCERKGFSYFMQLAGQLKSDETLVLVGLHEKQLKSLPSGVIGISRTHNTQELAELYSAADVYINPTLEDNFPTTNIEALACGTPVITFDSGGSPECLDAASGQVVNRRDFEGLLQAIANVKKNGKSHYAAACQQRAQESFDKNKRFMEYVRIYEAALQP